MPRLKICLVFLTAASLWFSGCTAKTVVTRVTPSGPDRSNDMNGVFYALPRTVIQVDVSVKKTVEKKGKYQKFAECFFGAKGIEADKTTVSIERATFSSRGEPDPGQVFMIKVPGRYFEDKTINLDLTSEGVMTKGEASSTNHAVEVAVAAIKTFTPIITSLATGGAATAAVKRDEQKGDITDRQKECLEAITPKPDDRELKEAIKTYVAIIELQARRDEFISGGQVGLGLPKETFEAMLKEIDRRIKSLTGLFLGTTDEQTWVSTHDFTPETTLMSRTLFEYAPRGADPGVCRRFYTGLNPIDPDFVTKYSCDSPLKVKLTVTVGRRGQSGPQFSQQVGAANLREGGERGFYYRIPSMTTAMVEAEEYESKDSNNIRTAEKGHDNVAVAQLGMVASLPASTNGRMTKYTLSLYENSGAMKNFTLGSDALIQSSQVSDIGTAVSSVVEARNKQRAAEAAANDELKRLERRRQILEEMVKIKQAEDALKTSSP